jgi:hypothetical protein
MIRSATWWQRASARLDVGPWQLGAWCVFVLYFALRLAEAKAAGRL